MLLGLHPDKQAAVAQDLPAGSESQAMHCP
jgi:hypothetical protein